MEGARSEREVSSELLERERRLEDVRARHAARVALLERHSGKLGDELRRLAKELETAGLTHTALQSRLKSSMLSVEGGEKEVIACKEAWRRARVEEALVRLRHAQASRALAGLGDTAFTIQKQRLQLEAAMNERVVEISARRDMFAVQKRSLLEDCGKLRCDIKEREQRIIQLKKRHDIFIASLGKDDSGEALSVTFFKIKFAADRAELREQGASLDSDISRAEHDVSALEHGLRLLRAAHNRLLQHISPVQADAPEIEDLQTLIDKYYCLREELQRHRSHCDDLRRRLDDTTRAHRHVMETHKLLALRECDTLSEVEGARERLARQKGKLGTARDQLRRAANRAKKLVDNKLQWRLFQIAVWVREYKWSAHAALTSLDGGHVTGRLATLLSDLQVEKLLPTDRAFKNTLLKIITRSQQNDTPEDIFDESVLSSASSSYHSKLSIESGNTGRLGVFRETLADKLDEPHLISDMRDSASRSAVSLKVVTLGLEDRTGSEKTRKKSH